MSVVSCQSNRPGGFDRVWRSRDRPSNHQVGTSGRHGFSGRHGALLIVFRVGGAAFFDIGRTWGESPVSTPSQGLLKDVGIGLRFGNSRSGLGNIIHVDLAFPLDGDSSIEDVQILLETKERF